MTRLFLPPEKLAGEKIIITGDEARYLSLVLRMKAGEQFVIFDGCGQRYICRILQMHKKKVVVEKIKNEPCSAESPISITLAQGLPKNDKMDLIVQKSTELGVRRIIPLITERSQVRHTEKVERWRKIALSASQQCGREKIPVIDGPVEFANFLLNIVEGDEGVIPAKAGIQRTRVGAIHELPLPDSPVKPENDEPTDKAFSKKTPLKLIFFEEQKGNNLKEVLTSFRDKENVTLLIGPEGGFSNDEVSASVEKGFIKASLGPRILRTETAPIAAISIIQYELGDIS
jgi:16S rRNA (uracil1498-N3)-methyltransferase